MYIYIYECFVRWRTQIIVNWTFSNASTTRLTELAPFKTHVCSWIQDGQGTLSGWWFGTWLLFFHILGIITPTEFHIFQRDRNHQSALMIKNYDWSNQSNHRKSDCFHFLFVLILSHAQQDCRGSDTEAGASPRISGDVGDGFDLCGGGEGRRSIYYVFFIAGKTCASKSMASVSWLFLH